MRYLKKVFCIFILGACFSCKKEDPAPLPIADFYASNNGCEHPCTISFFDHSTNAVRLSWNFGNGVTSTKLNDTCTYADSGMYVVRLSVWNEDNIIDSIAKDIYIQ